MDTMAKEIVISRSGLTALEQELEELKTVRRKDVAEKIKTARGFGDLSENSEYDEAKTVDDTVVIALSVQGKTKDTVEIPLDADEDTAFAAAMKSEKFAALVEGKQIVKKIYVKNKILNVIVK